MNHEWEETKSEFLVSYGTPERRIGALLREMLIPVIRAMHEQKEDGIFRCEEEDLIALKKLIARPVENGCLGDSMEEIKRDALENGTETLSYVEFELNHLLRYGTSFDLSDDTEFVVGNFCDVNYYYISKQDRKVWRVPNRRSPFNAA
jgi:hypothetical protein